jgi:hypothetical protein
MAQIRACTRYVPFDLDLLVRKEADEHVESCPTLWVGMAFPLRMRRKRRSFSASIAWTKVGAHAQRTLLFLLARPGQNPCLGDPDYRTSLRAQGSGEPKFAPIDLLARADILSMEPPSHLRTASHTPGELRPRRRPDRAEVPWPWIDAMHAHPDPRAENVPGFACADVKTHARHAAYEGAGP